MEGRESVEWALACAFHGCCVERMYVNSRCGWLPKMPHNVAVKRLHLFLGGGERAEDITEFLSRIHKIEVSVACVRGLPKMLQLDQKSKMEKNLKS